MYKMKIKYWSMCSCGALIVSQNLLHLLKQLWLLVSLICEASVWEGLRWIKLTFLTFLPLKSCSSDLLLTGLTANFCVSEKGQRGGAVRADRSCITWTSWRRTTSASASWTRHKSRWESTHCKISCFLIGGERFKVDQWCSGLGWSRVLVQHDRVVSVVESMFCKTQRK